jgi:hypothetical protein
MKILKIVKAEKGRPLKHCLPVVRMFPQNRFLFTEKNVCLMLGQTSWDPRFDKTCSSFCFELETPKKVSLLRASNPVTREIIPIAHC